MRDIKENILLWRRILSNYKYFFLILITAVLFYLLNVFITNIRNFSSLFDSLGLSGSLKLFFNISLNFNKIVPAYTFYSLVIISLLTGLLISILCYKFNISKESNKSLSIIASAGLFLGFIAPGCASCGLGILAIFGLSSSLAVLPFKGFELSLLAIIILGFSIFKISDNICGCKACKINISI